VTRVPAPLSNCQDERQVVCEGEEAAAVGTNAAELMAQREYQSLALQVKNVETTGYMRSVHGLPTLGLADFRRNLIEHL
jgi:hypothetical protein